MNRDQRVYDNWALAYAIELAENSNQHVVVVFNIHEGQNLGWRQFDFMFKGLQKAEHDFRNLNIPFKVLLGAPSIALPTFVRQYQISRIVTDFSPLKPQRKWLQEVLDEISIPVDEVDAHNIIPCFVASDKEEWSAATFRNRIARQVSSFMDEYPPLIAQRQRFNLRRNNWKAIRVVLTTDQTIRPLEWLTPGAKAAESMLHKFLRGAIHQYAMCRNDANTIGTSQLSPYLHFGHISAQRIALEVAKNLKKDENTDAFMDELIVRRELADNFCYYNPKYDSPEGFRPWAIKTLLGHADDAREYLYSEEQFELGLTHDALWNAAQRQMVYTGTMPGYLRMYWAKKILEWAPHPEKALQIALRLNYKYQMDGQDPNGYAGCAWAIGGVHDRAWGERNVYGKIRYMNQSGCRRKFDIRHYIDSIKMPAQAQQ
jgi:deoxyribodipyrimidine photo-lyase